MRIDERHEAAADSMVRGEAVRAIARQLGVTPKTVREWRDKPEFQKLIETRKATVLGVRESAITPLVTKAAEATGELIDLVQSTHGQDKFAIAGLRSMVAVLGKLAAIEAEDRIRFGATPVLAGKAPPSAVADLDALGLEGEEAEEEEEEEDEEEDEEEEGTDGN